MNPRFPKKLATSGTTRFTIRHRKKGYSGVAILSKAEPEEVHVGMGSEWVDAEGRVVRARIKGVDVFSIYAPSGTTGDARQSLKMQFLEEFTAFVQVARSTGKPFVFLR